MKNGGRIYPDVCVFFFLPRVIKRHQPLRSDISGNFLSEAVYYGNFCIKSFNFAASHAGVTLFECLRNRWKIFRFLAKWAFDFSQIHSEYVLWRLKRIKSRMLTRATFNDGSPKGLRSSSFTVWMFDAVFCQKIKDTENEFRGALFNSRCSLLEAR